MRKLILALAVSLLPAGNAAAESSWFGEFVVHGQKGTCTGDSVSQKAFARFRPQVSGNGKGSRITLIYPWGAALNLELDKGNYGGGFKVVNTMFIHAFASPIGNEVSVKFKSIKPSLSANAEYYEIAGELKGGNFQAKCIQEFRMALIKEPG